MSDSAESTNENERIIKSKKRIQNHGEVFTPKRIVNKMLDLPAVREACQRLTATFLEPAAGEGAFLVEVLQRKLKMVARQYGDDLARYEHHSLLALSTLYGVELLEDNALKCVMNLYQVYYEAYRQQAAEHGKKMAGKALDSAKRIVSNHIAQGNFLTRRSADGRPIAFGEWRTIENMKFDVIIGNPPYQELDGGAQVSATPIYQHFVRLAKGLNPDIISYIMPTRWYAGGKGLDDFRDEMLGDVHLRELHDWLTPEDIFPSTNIRGGVCYFVWDRSYDNTRSLTRVVTHENNAVTSDLLRPMRIPGADIFIRDSVAVRVLYRIFGGGGDGRELELNDTMMNYVSSAKAFGFRGFFVKDEKFRPSPAGLVDPVKCYGLRAAEGYVERSEVPSRAEWIDRWKIFTAESNNIGTELNDDNFNTILGAPGTICTETYVVIGADLALDEAQARHLSAYLQTKFSRYLHSIAKTSQHGTKSTYRFIPLQDFTSDSAIDWSASPQALDQQLYAKYGLSEDEIGHIERRIKAM